jgi:CheY-like chemotaxis protein/anti-sigma regulatory factor (Ser/Thr protein kinase)
MTVVKEPFDLRALTDDVIELARQGTHQPLSFLCCYPDDLPCWITGDEQRTRQVLFNLIGNAAKFTEHGEVRLNVRFSEDQLEMCVIDTGIGISPEVMARLFKSFTQADASIGKQFGGTGLGLAISRDLARLMGGDIQLESEVGKGTTARFTLPANIVAPQDNRDDDHGERHRLAVSKRLRVLAVDDIGVNLELISLMLEGEGHVVVTAGSGPAALAVLTADSRFDLILMDVQMPGMDGLQTTRAIRDLDGPAVQIPIIALSANVMPEQIAACRAAGMEDHLAKPIRRAALIGVLDRKRDAVGKRATAPLPELDPIAALRDRYRAQMKTLSDELTGLLDLPEPPRRRSIAALAHSMAGTAGSFDFDEVSSAAFDLEAAARSDMSDPNTGTEIANLVHTLQTAIATSQDRS